MTNNISDKAYIGNNVTFKGNCTVEAGARIGDNCYIDSNSIIRSGTTIGSDSFIGANCIIGEYMMDFCLDREMHDHKLTIGNHALLRSGTIIYTESEMGDHFQTGHRVTIREKSRIGTHCSIGTLSDIQGNCSIGDYVRMHSNVHIGQLSVVDNYVWIFPYVVLTNDPTPPSEDGGFIGVHIHKFALISTGSVLLPGVSIGRDALVGASSNVTRDVSDYALVVGNPAKQIKDVRNMKNNNGENIYPWRFHFNRAMPWEKEGFIKWYRGLSDQNKFQYSVDETDLC